MAVEAWQPKEFKPKREKEYRLYLLWKSLPLAMRKGGEQYLQQLGIDNPDIAELASIRTQTQFGHKYDVDLGTLSIWNRQEVPMEYRDMDWRVWAKHLASEVLMKLWEGIEERKDPASIKLYMQLIGEYQETSKVQVDYTTDLFDGMRTLVENMNKEPGQPALEASGVERKRPKRPLNVNEKTIPELLRKKRKSDPDYQENPVVPNDDA